jgi:hypothetical protein
MESSAFACHRGVERERVEVILDRAEAARPQGACLLVAGYEYSEVQLGQ